MLEVSSFLPSSPVARPGAMANRARGVTAFPPLPASPESCQLLAARHPSHARVVLNSVVPCL